MDEDRQVTILPYYVDSNVSFTENDYLILHAFVPATSLVD
jgi:hypothetical protein